MAGVILRQQPLGDRCRVRHHGIFTAIDESGTGAFIADQAERRAGGGRLPVGGVMYHPHPLLQGPCGAVAPSVYCCIDGNVSRHMLMVPSQTPLASEDCGV